MLLTLFLILIDVCVPLNYLTCEKNGAIELQHNNNNTPHIISIFAKNTFSDITFYLCEYKQMAKSEGRCLAYRPPCDTVSRPDITLCRE